MSEPPADSKLNPTTVLRLHRCKEGDRDALNELVVRFYPPVFRMVRARRHAWVDSPRGPG